MDEYACMRQIILLPTEELLHALREWQDLILAGEQHVFEHPQFVAIIKEVQMRNLIDRDGNWMIEL